MNRIGLNFFPVALPGELPAAAWYAECLELAEAADELGYSCLRTVEHHGPGYGGYCPNPIPLLAAASQRTRALRLQTGAVVPAFHHPTRLAEDLAMLDHLTGGRLDIGLARGFLPHEFDLFGVDMDESHHRLVRGIDELVWLWSSESSPLGLRPLQEPHPPMWLAATTTKSSYEFAGRMGLNVMVVTHLAPLSRLAELIDVYRTAWRSAGRKPGEERVQVGSFLFVAEDARHALVAAERAFNAYNRRFADALASWSGRSSTAYEGYQELQAALRNADFGRALAEHRLLAGDPPAVDAQITAIEELLGPIELTAQVNPAGTPLKVAMETLHHAAALTTLVVSPT